MVLFTNFSGASSLLRAAACSSEMAKEALPASRYRGSAIGLRRGAADLEFACAESDLAACIKPLFRMGIV